MLTLHKRHDRTIPGDGAGRSARATAVSVIVHIVLLFALVQALQSTGAIQRIFVKATDFSFGQPIERLQYIAVAPPRTPPPAVAPQASAGPASQGGAPQAGRTTGGEADPGTPLIPSVPLVSPNAVPVGIPAPGAGFDVNVGTPAGGPLASGRGAVKGLQPGYVDPRLWVEAPVLVYAPKSDEERLDSAVSTSIMRYRDSLLANGYTPNRFEQGDWTYRTKDGKRYGIDQQFIRLGKFSIPTALLALLPMNQVQGNPIENDRQRRLAAMRIDIMQGAEAAMNEEEFRQAVKKIRARKDKERKEAEAKKKGDVKTISER
ncbi:MAG: hypothetical protein IPF98_12540 [Gemmatimonadetes bacterium]|nr:hypothetical protein [Gemmatimonadota bacterium]MCC6771505.1 hypothetical protein [Gemmatimonadaceae bacterium]